MRLLFTLILLLVSTRSAAANSDSGRSETTTGLGDDYDDQQSYLRQPDQESFKRMMKKKTKFSSKNSKKTGASSSKNCDDDEDDAVTVQAVKSDAVIRPEGGEITLPDYAFVDFPSGAFASDTQVSVKTTNDIAATELFNEYVKLFHVSAETSYMVSVEIDSQLMSSAPAPVAVLFIPQELKDKVPLGSKIDVFGKTTESSNLGPDDLQYDMFANLPSTIVESGPPSGMAIIFALYPALFKPKSEAGKTTYQAVFKLAVTPGTTRAIVPSPSNRRKLEYCNLDKCPSTSLRCPLKSGCEVVSSYNPVSIGDPTSQHGISLRVNTGEEILSPVDGIVVGVGPDRILIQLYDGNHVLLTRLGRTIVTTGEVKRGDVIGYATRNYDVLPVMNLQYFVFGGSYETSGLVDPEPCIGGVGNILLGDNGPISDDSFTLLVDGVKRVNVEVAPDNIGTFFVELANGWEFVGGSTSKSDSAPQGAAYSYDFIVPVSSANDCVYGNWWKDTAYYEDETCQKWAAAQEKEGTAWLDGLTPCPCEQEYKCEDRLFFDKCSKAADGFEWLGRAGKLHQGASHCMRSETSLFSFVVPGQQCCYDYNGKLITNGYGAGTPDRHAGAVAPVALLHWIYDVRPFDDCPCNTYLKYRPPNQGEDPKTGKACPVNVVSAC
ncbi:MAG: hypothetical protein SGBAC_011423 [Bacillariaceae sp.]